MVQRRSFISLMTSLGLIPAQQIAFGGQTPVPAIESPLLSLLARLPDNELGDLGIRFADYHANLAAHGIAEGGAVLEPEAWLTTMGDQTLIPRAFGDPTNPAIREGLGFDLRDVSAMVEAGTSDERILVLTGRFEETALTTAWEASGYAADDSMDVTWYTLGEDNALRFDDPFHMVHLGMLSHLALFDDATVVGTSKRKVMEELMAVWSGDQPSYADNEGMALGASPTNLASGWIVDGEVLLAPDRGLLTMPGNPNISTTNQDRLATQVAHTEEEAPQMPPLAMALVGTTAGGEAATADEPQPNAVAVVFPVDPAHAALVAETVSRRLESETLLSEESLNGESLLGRSYSNLFTEQSVATSSNGAVLITLTPADGVPPSLLHRLLQSRNLSILYWAG